jgi:DNA-binding MarR family transcriptional regulator
MALSKLASDLKKRKPFELPEEEVYVSLLRTTHWLVHEAEQLLKPMELSEATYNVLRILRGAADTEGESGLPCQEVGSRMVTRVPDVTRLVDRLIAQGFAKRERLEEDRRVVRLSITAKGRDVLEKLEKPLHAMHRRQLSNLTKTEMEQLCDLLERVRQNARPPG